MLDEHASRAFAFLLETVAFGLYGGVIVCGADEGDDEIFDGSEELYYLLVRVF